MTSSQAFAAPISTQPIVSIQNGDRMYRPLSVNAMLFGVLGAKVGVYLTERRDSQNEKPFHESSHAYPNNLSDFSNCSKVTFNAVFVPLLLLSYSLLFS